MPLLTPKQAAAELGISQDQLLKLTERGALPYVNIGLGAKRQARRYEPDDIGAFKVARRKVECPSTGAPARKPTPMTSGYRVVDFSAERKKRRSAVL